MAVTTHHHQLKTQLDEIVSQLQVQFLLPSLAQWLLTVSIYDSSEREYKSQLGHLRHFSHHYWTLIVTRISNRAMWKQKMWPASRCGGGTGGARFLFVFCANYLSTVLPQVHHITAERDYDANFYCRRRLWQLWLPPHLATVIFFFLFLFFQLIIIIKIAQQKRRADDDNDNFGCYSTGWR